MGAVLVHPRAAMRALLTQGQGSMSRLFIWLALVAIAAEPVRAGRAFLVGRQQLLDGLILLLNTLAGRLIEPILLVIMAATALYVIGRAKRAQGGAGIGFDAASDVAAYFLVPFILVIAVSAILDAVGLGFAALPLHGVRGTGLVWVGRIFLAYGWSVYLFFVGAWELWHAPSAGSSS